jgi:dihydrofolate synthase / folylpolyglutamate synthase
VTSPGERRQPPGLSYAATLRYLYALQYRGIKVGLKNIRLLVERAGHPERTFPVFHCAGTNGKGSTSSFLASILTAAGYRTGLYTSPHLVNFVERIRIDGVPIDERALVAYVRRLRPAIEETHATFFEATTCIAFQYFADREVDVAVIETGLGGRLDATNVVIPIASIITNIGMDHQEILGTTIRKIAREKAGIIKPGAPVVTGTTGIAFDVVRESARRCGARVHVPGQRTPVRLLTVDRGHAVVSLEDVHWKVARVRLGLAGEHQGGNAGLAVTALALARNKGLFPGVTSLALKRGLERVKVNTGLRCRMERVRLPWADLTLDVGHNPDGIRVSTAPFARKGRGFDLAVFGAMKDKDIRGMLSVLGETTGVIVAVRPHTSRAATVREIVRTGTALGITIIPGGAVAHGIVVARRITGRATRKRKPRILIIGSHYVAGEALLALEKTT